jgi:uncharacterized protein YoxC
MNATITLGEAGSLLIGLALFVLIVYCIILVKNLVPSIKSVSKILKDTEVISGVAADSTKEVQKIVVDFSSSVGSMADIIKGNQSIIAALTSIVNAIGSLKNLIKK